MSAKSVLVWEPFARRFHWSLVKRKFQANHTSSHCWKWNIMPPQANISVILHLVTNCNLAWSQLITTFTLIASFVFCTLILSKYQLVFTYWKCVHRYVNSVTYVVHLGLNMASKRISPPNLFNIGVALGGFLHSGVHKIMQSLRKCCYWKVWWFNLSFRDFFLETHSVTTWCKICASQIHR